MSAIVAVALADFRQRTRTFGVLLVIAVALQAGYLSVPDASATYATVNLGSWRGLYDSAWMGATTSLLTIMLLPLAGFFLVRPALHRDVVLGTNELVACAPIGRLRFVVGKFASNFAFVAGVALVLVLAAIVMQFVRGESRTFSLISYALPYLIITLPACALVAAAAIAIDSVRLFRGIVGGIVWFFVWNALLAIPVLSTPRGGIAAFDPLGLTTMLSALLGGLHAAVPGAHVGQDPNIGVTQVRHLRTFRFDGVPWSTTTLLTRIVWTASAVALCAVVSPIALDVHAAKARQHAASGFRNFLTRVPLPPLGRIEFTQAMSAAGIWWTIGMLALAVAALAVPSEALIRIVAPLVWIWPVAAIAAVSVVDAHGLDDVLRATPTAAFVRVLWRWVAACSLAAIPVIALAVRAGPSGAALTAIAAAAVACGIALGAFTRAPLAFQTIALLAWYLGPVNRLPFVNPATSSHAPLEGFVVAVVLTIVALGATSGRIAQRG